MRRSLAVSALVHAAILFFALRTPQSSESKPLLQFVEVSPGTESVSKAPRGKIGTGRSKKKTSLSMSELGITWVRSKGSTFAYPSNSAGGAGSPSASSFGGGLQGTPLEFVSKTVVHDYLHQKLDAAVDYPRELVDEGMEGTVKARLVFSPDGAWLRGRSHVVSSSRYLRVHILQVLRRLFKNPLPKGYLRGEELKVECHFLFEVARQENLLDSLPRDLPENPAKKGFVGNHLSLYRYGKRLGEWKLGPLAGYALAPNVLAIDPSWFVEQVEGLLSSKEKPDPLRRYREDPQF